MWIFLAVKIENFVGIHFDTFNNFVQNIDCGYTLEPPRRGGSNEYPKYMFVSKIRKKTQFYYVKVGIMGYTLYGHVILMSFNILLCKSANLSLLLNNG